MRDKGPFALGGSLFYSCLAGSTVSLACSDIFLGTMLRPLHAAAITTATATAAVATAAAAAVRFSYSVAGLVGPIESLS